MHLILIVLFSLAVFNGSVFAQPNYIPPFPQFPGPQQSAVQCDPGAPQLVIGEYNFGGQISVLCQVGGHYKIKAKMYNIYANAIAVIPTPKGRITYVLSNGKVRRVEEVVSGSTSGIMTAAQETEWPVSIGRGTFVSATPTSFVLGGENKEVGQYRINSDGDLVVSRFGTGKVMGDGCLSFARLVRGDEFCSAFTGVYRGKAEFTGIRWDTPEVLMQIQDPGNLAAWGDDLYVMINPRQEYAPTACSAPICPPGEVVVNRVPQVVRYRFVGFERPQVEEVLSDPSISHNSPLAVSGGKLYFSA